MRTQAVRSGRRGPVLAFALVLTFVGRGEAGPVDRPEPPSWPIRSVRHGTTAAAAAHGKAVAQTSGSATVAVRGGGTGAFVINPTFDTSITNHPHAAAS